MRHDLYKVAQRLTLLVNLISMVVRAAVLLTFIFALDCARQIHINCFRCVALACSDKFLGDFNQDWKRLYDSWIIFILLPDLICHAVVE